MVDVPDWIMGLTLAASLGGLVLLAKYLAFAVMLPF